MIKIINLAGPCLGFFLRLRGAVHASLNYYVFMEFAGDVSLHKVLHARCGGANLPGKVMYV